MYTKPPPYQRKMRAVTGKDDYSWVDKFPVRWKDRRKFAAWMYSL